MGVEIIDEDKFLALLSGKQKKVIQKELF
jgi:hypothetical protein